MKEFLERLKAGSLTGNEKITPIYNEYDKPELNRSEILRYAGFPAAVLRAKGKWRKENS